MLHYLILLMIGIGILLIIIAVFVLKEEPSTNGLSGFDTENIIKVMDKSVEDVDTALEEFTKISEDVFEELNQKYQELIYLYSLIDEKEKTLTKSAFDIQVDDSSDLEPEMEPAPFEGEEPIAKEDVFEDDLDEGTLQPDFAASYTEQYYGDQVKDLESVLPVGMQAPVAEAVLEGQISIEESLADELYNYVEAPHGSRNDEIYHLYAQGMDHEEIAKSLGIGKGEVRLVLELGKARG